MKINKLEFNILSQSYDFWCSLVILERGWGSWRGIFSLVVLSAMAETLFSPGQERLSQMGVQIQALCLRQAEQLVGSGSGTEPLSRGGCRFAYRGLWDIHGLGATRKKFFISDLKAANALGTRGDLNAHIPIEQGKKSQTRQYLLFFGEELRLGRMCRDFNFVGGTRIAFSVWAGWCSARSRAGLSGRPRKETPSPGWLRFGQ